MLKRLRIQNFKGWKDTGDIRLAPISLFFGANSSGNSSIGQFLMILKQTVESPDRKAVIYPGGNTSVGSQVRRCRQRSPSQAADFAIDRQQVVGLERGVARSGHYRPFPVPGICQDLVWGEDRGVKDEFFKFPSTPHLATLLGVDIRGDKVLSEAKRDQFLQHVLLVEEKIDGANLGISFDSEGDVHAQNQAARLHLPGSGQWKKLGDWLTPRMETLFECLSDELILFGEWCYAQHSVYYDRLPDWFLGFDLYNKRAGRFLSSARRDVLFGRMGIEPVPVLARGHFTFLEIQKLISTSQFSDQPAEGLYLRFDEDDWLAQRAKLVRAAFIQGIHQHWSRSAIKPNRLRLESRWSNRPG